MTTIRITNIKLKYPGREIAGENGLERAKRIHEEFRLHDRYRRAMRASQGATPGAVMIATGLQRRALLAVDWTNAEEVDAYYQLAGRTQRATNKMRQKLKAAEALRILRVKGLVLEEL